MLARIAKHTGLRTCEADCSRKATGLRRGPRDHPLNEPYCENVLQDDRSPLLSPAVSHLTRWPDEPWVKLSGTA